MREIERQIAGAWRKEIEPDMARSAADGGIERVVIPQILICAGIMEA
jgi:hypothetical protein